MPVPSLQHFHSFPTFPDHITSTQARKSGTYKVFTYNFSYLESLASLPGYEEPHTEDAIQGEAAINNLPVELIAKIFEMVIIRTPFRAGDARWESNSDYVNLRWSRRQAPFNLLQVCSSWRAIVQSTSSLWSSLSALQFRHSRPAVTEMKYWLKNSGSAPLRLHLDRVERGSVYQDPSHTYRLLGLFALHAYRWESLALSLTLPLVKEFTVIMQKNHREHGFPFLKQLELYLDLPCSCDQYVVERLTDAIASLKTLRRLYWRVSGNFEGYLNLPWNQLDTIHIIMPHSIESAVSWLSKCNAASSITLHKLEAQETDTITRDSLLRLPLLKHLDLHGLPAIDILARLTLPNLQTLHVETGSTDTKAYGTLEALLVRSQCMLLKEVSISEFCCSSMIQELVLHYLSIVRLHAVPTVEITHDRMHTSLYRRLQLQTLPENVKLPQIIAWQGSRSYSRPAIGWKALGVEDEKVFRWDNGKMEIFCDPSLLVAKN